RPRSGPIISTRPRSRQSSTSRPKSRPRSLISLLCFLPCYPHLCLSDFPAPPQEGHSYSLPAPWVLHILHYRMCGERSTYRQLALVSPKFLRHPKEPVAPFAGGPRLLK